MKVMLDEGAKVERAHELDAGLDLCAREDAYILANNSYVFDTGVHVEIPKNCVGFIKSRSGLMVRHGILTDGTIDCGYTGPIKVKLFNLSGSRYEVKKGDKIAQLVIVPCILAPVELVGNLEETERGDGGFGSTGR